jgi:hypothetical protein
MNPLTKWQLFGALANGSPLQTSTAHFIIVNAVQREDGSNRSWNVTGIVRDRSKSEIGYSETVHVRTID